MSQAKSKVVKVAGFGGIKQRSKPRAVHAGIQKAAAQPEWGVTTLLRGSETNMMKAAINYHRKNRLEARDGG